MGLHLHPEAFGDLEELAHQPRQRDLVERQAEDRLGDRARGLGEPVDRLIGRHEPRRDMDLGDPVVVADEERIEHVREVAPRRPVDPPHDAEIDRVHPALAVDQQVPRVEVGMEEAVAEDLEEEHRGHEGDDLREVVPFGLQPFAVVDRHAVDPARSKDAPCGPPPVDRRHLEPVHVLEIGLKLLRRRGFEAEIHLDPRRFREGFDRLHRLEPVEGAVKASDDTRQPSDQVEVAVECRLDAGSQHLDRHLLALGGHGAVHLGDRGRGDGLVVEFGEDLVEAAIELLLDGLSRLAARERGQAILQLGEIRRQLLADQIGTHRERLAQLHEGRSQLLERRRQLLAGTP